MRATLSASAPILVFALTACGTDPAPGPTEQIVVREPGAAAVQADETEDSLITIGKAAFNTCVACHGIEKGGANKVGPNLYGIIGQAAGAVEGFSYSEALSSSGITWTKEELDSYIANPAAKVPGTTMMAGAITDADRREAIIAYINAVSAN